MRISERDAMPVRVVIGLGNPGDKYKDTPHNVGQRVLDRLASSLDVSWERWGAALVATADRNGVRLHLVKPLVYVNSTGPVLRELAAEIGFGPNECVLVHDDMDLAIGTSRIRLRGGDGGHRGMRSVIEAFETDSIARVKIGVGRPGRRGEAAAHVVRPFSMEEMAMVEAACAAAMKKVLDLASRPAAPAAPQGPDGLVASAA
jgi:PTH1 family peptidyl-tRNA hydrolase